MYENSVLQSGDALSSIASIILAHLFEIVTVLVAVPIIVVPLWWDKRRRRKQLTYRIKSNEALRRGMPGLEVTFNRQPIPNPHLCTFAIANTGTVSFQKTDFEREIVVSFIPCSHQAHTNVPPKIMAYELTDRDPENLSPPIILPGDGTIRIFPMLLNPTESFTLRVLLDECFRRDKINFDARIEGIKEIKPPPEPWLRSSLFQIVMSMLLLVLAATSAAVLPGLAASFGVIIAFLSGVYLIASLGELVTKRKRS